MHKCILDGLAQNKYKNTLVGVLRTNITFNTHSSPSCYVTLRTQVIWVLRKPTRVSLILKLPALLSKHHNLCIWPYVYCSKNFV